MRLAAVILIVAIAGCAPDADEETPPQAATADTTTTPTPSFDYSDSVATLEKQQLARFSDRVQPVGDRLIIRTAPGRDVVLKDVAVEDPAVFVRFLFIGEVPELDSFLVKSHWYEGGGVCADSTEHSAAGGYRC